MSVRRLVIEVDPASMNVTEFCRSHGISTWFFWNLRRRYQHEGDAVLEPKSRAPRRVGNKTPVDIEDAIVRARKELTDGGLDAGPSSVWFELRNLPGVPSEATIWRILRARGLITPDPSKAPKRTKRRFNAERANECWQVDDTGWVLADGTEVKVLNIIDDHSRLLVGSVAMQTVTGAATLEAFGQAATTLGWPERFLSDNASAFRYVLADALAPLGIAAGHSRPYHPQTCGKVERFHQTLKRWLDRQPPAATLADLQAQLDIFRHHYNHRRPHRAHNRRFPAAVWEQAPKSGPSDRPIGQTSTVRTLTVHGGRITVKDHLISVGAAHDKQRALVITTGNNCHIFINGTLVRALTIDPTRRTQPLYTTPGRPPTTTVSKDPRHP